MKAATAAIVAGSVGLTLKSCVCSSRVSTNDAATPTTRPTPREPHPLAEDHPEHALPRRAQRHVDADLLAPLADRVGEDAVGADRGQRQRQTGEITSSCAEEARPRDRLAEHLVHRPQLDDRQRRIHRRDDAADVGGQRLDRQRRSHDDVHVARREVDEPAAPGRRGSTARSRSSARRRPASRRARRRRS